MTEPTRPSRRVETLSFARIPVVVAVVAALLAAAPLLARPAAAGEPVAAEPGVAAPDVAPSPETDAADDDSAEPAPGEAAVVDPADAAPPPLDGPLRPKGETPGVPAAAPPRREAWTPSFDRGVRWSKGDTSISITGAPGTGLRIGGTITR